MSNESPSFREQLFLWLADAALNQEPLNFTEQQRAYLAEKFAPSLERLAEAEYIFTGINNIMATQAKSRQLESIGQFLDRWTNFQQTHPFPK